MKIILTRSGAILCIIGLSALYLIGLAASADTPAWFESNIPMTYIHYLIDVCIVGLSLAWFCHTKPGDSSVHPYRWCRLIPAALIMSYQNFRWEISGYVPMNGDEWWELVYWGASFLITFLACCLITQVVQALRNHTSPKWKIIVKVALAGFLIWFTYWRPHYFNDYVQSFYVFFLPVYFYLAAKGITHLCHKSERLKTWANPLYFLTTIILILFSLFHFVWYGFHSDELVQSIYFCITAGMALWFVHKQQNPDTEFNQWFFRNKGRKFYESPLLGTGIVSALTILTNSRFYEIIASIHEDTEPYIFEYAVEGSMRFYNWFAYRWTVLKGNLLGNLEAVEKINAWRVPQYSSLAWLNSVYGILPAAAALFLLTSAFILLWKCAENSDRLSRYLYAVLLLRTVLGLIANLLVVYSTEITPLMLGLMPWDVIFVIMILWTRKDNMKKRKNKVCFIIIFAAMMTTILTGCLKLRSAEQDAKPAETATWKQAYEEVLRQTYTECDAIKPNESKHYGRYGLYDYDQDDIPELFLEVYGTPMTDYVIHVYDFVRNELTQLDDIQSGHAWVYGVNEPNAVLFGYSGTGGILGWTLLRYENGEFQSEFLTEYYPGGSPWNKPEEDPLTKMGYTLTNLESCDLSDLSILEDY